MATKSGRTLGDLAAELERQQTTKRDFIADTRKLTMTLDAANVPALTIQTLPDLPALPIRPACHRQIGERVGIPAKYYDRMLTEAPALLAGNVNHWLQTKPETRMVRSLDGGARAFLSNKYRRLDNIDVAEATLPRLIESGCRVVSAEVTENKLYIKAVTTRLEGEVKRGDVVQGGVVISNSEIGGGALSVATFLLRLICTNGMVRDEGMRRAHLGRHVEEASELFSERTLDLDDKALFAKVGDTVRALLSPEHFGRHLAALQSAASGIQIAAPSAAVVELGKRYNLGDGERESFLAHLIRGGDLSKWGAANALTSLAGDVDSYDRATELEAAGGLLIELAPKDWASIAEAA